MSGCPGYMCPENRHKKTNPRNTIVISIFNEPPNFLKQKFFNNALELFRL